MFSKKSFPWLWLFYHLWEYKFKEKSTYKEFKKIAQVLYLHDYNASLFLNFFFFLISILTMCLAFHLGSWNTYLQDTHIFLEIESPTSSYISGCVIYVQV